MGCSRHSWQIRSIRGGFRLWWLREIGLIRRHRIHAGYSRRSRRSCTWGRRCCKTRRNLKSLKALATERWKTVKGWLLGPRLPYPQALSARFSAIISIASSTTACTMRRSSLSNVSSSSKSSTFTPLWCSSQSTLTVWSCQINKKLASRAQMPSA